MGDGTPHAGGIMDRMATVLALFEPRQTVVVNLASVAKMQREAALLAECERELDELEAELAEWADVAYCEIEEVCV